MKWAIYELTPAPWGDNYRYVDSFESYQDAQIVLGALESVNPDYKVYKIVNWDQPLKGESISFTKE